MRQFPDSLFCVVCEVDNGASWKTYNTYIYAPSALVASKRAKEFWNKKDSETTANVIEVSSVYPHGFVCTVEKNKKV